MECKYLGFLERTLESIVNHPEDVLLEKSTDEMGVLIKVKIHKDDFPIVIGKQGKVIDALRTLVRSVAAKENARVSIKLEDDPRRS